VSKFLDLAKSLKSRAFSWGQRGETRSTATEIIETVLNPKTGVYEPLLKPSVSSKLPAIVPKTSSLPVALENSSALPAIIPGTPSELLRYEGSIHAARAIDAKQINVGASKRILPDDVARLAEQNLTDSGTTVLGSFRAKPGKPNYIQKAQARVASYFDVGNSWDDLVSRGLEWDANRHFLDVISSRGDDILLSIPKTEIIPGSYLSREIQYLVSARGYRWVNQWKLVAR
jgi:hypothetical protein